MPQGKDAFEPDRPDVQAVQQGGYLLHTYCLLTAYLLLTAYTKVFHAVTVDQMRRHIEKSHHGVTFEELHLDFQCRICMEPERLLQ